MEITIISWWWVVPTILTLITWVFLHIKLDANNDGISALVYLLSSGFLTTLYWLIYFIIF